MSKKTVESFAIPCIIFHGFIQKGITTMCHNSYVCFMEL